MLKRKISYRNNPLTFFDVLEQKIHYVESECGSRRFVVIPRLQNPRK
nr:MAG TPA: hypothetical protein [Caudoviricetes sp.]